MKSLSASLASTVLSAFLCGCSVTWVSEAPVDATDGSKVVTTAFYKQYGRDRLSIERTGPDGSRSIYVIKELPENFHDHSLLDAGKKSVKIRLMDEGKRTIQELDIPYSSFTVKGA